MLLQRRAAAASAMTSVRRARVHVGKVARAGFVVSTAVFGAQPHTRGFLPATDPPERLATPDAAAQEWEQALSELPAAFAASGSGALLRDRLRRLPPFPTNRLLPPPAITDINACDCFTDDGDAWRSYLVLSFLAHAFVWCEPGPPPAVLPAVLAVPWARLSAALDMPPILTYATYNLLNWKRLDPERPPALENLTSINNFLGGPDEEWFRLVHVDIEARAGPAVAGLQRLQQAAAQDDAAAVQRGLDDIASALRSMQATLARIGQHCDPEQYYHRVRPPIAGWRNNPLLPHGLVYEGVYEGVYGAGGGAAVPVQLYGATGAQSSVVPAFDRVLDIRHEQGRLRDYLDTMVAHMPPPHRAFLAQLAAANDNTGTGGTAGGTGSSSSSGAGQRQAPAAANVRTYVLAAAASGSGHPRGGELRDAYDCALEELERFRSLHRAVAQRYILQPAAASAAPAPAAGTAPHYAHSAAATSAAATGTGPAPAVLSSRHVASVAAGGAGCAGLGWAAPVAPAAVTAAAASPPQPPPALAARMATQVPSGGAGDGGGRPVGEAGALTDAVAAAAGQAAAVAAAEAVAAAAEAAGAGVTGTGGSDVIPALTAFRDATRHHKIGAAGAVDQGPIGSTKGGAPL